MRKLVLETAKFNVLTAHSTREAFDLFHLFPNVSMAVRLAVVHGEVNRIRKDSIKNVAVGHEYARGEVAHSLTGLGLSDDSQQRD